MKETWATGVLRKLSLRLRVGLAVLFVITFFVPILRFDVRLSLLIALLIALLATLAFRLFIAPNVWLLSSRVAELEQIAEEHTRGARMLIRRDLELSRANEKLRELDQVKSNFISVVAHQLRTPLSGIKWTLNMLLSGELGALTNEQKVFLMKSYESNDRMIALVNDMLGADRIQSGKIKYDFRFISAVNLLDNVLFELAPQAAKKKVSISFKNNFANLPRVFVDPDSARAVFQNLIENAIKYTMSGGKVEIGMEPDGEFLVITVEDNGIGIPKDQQKNLFNRFFRARNAIKQETDGSGLGLYIAKSIIERHGGTIWYESEEGRGVSFHFTLPTKALTPAAQAAAQANV